MSKKYVAVVTTTAICAIAAGVAFLLKWRKQKKVSDVIDVEETDDAEEEETVETVDEEIDNMIVHRFIAYLVKNGLDAEEAISVCETIIQIQEYLPNVYPEIAERMNDIMHSEFDRNMTMEFDKSNFTMLYPAKSHPSR